MQSSADVLRADQAPTERVKVLVLAKRTVDNVCLMPTM
jgi:hypothetical protein